MRLSGPAGGEVPEEPLPRSELFAGESAVVGAGEGPLAGGAEGSSAVSVVVTGDAGRRKETRESCPRSQHLSLPAPPHTTVGA